MSQLLGVCLWLAFTANAAAQPLDPNALPPELKPWVSWVRDRNPQRQCVQAPEGTRCLWPSELQLRLSDQGGTFRIRLVADAPQLATLPGQTRRWPQSVRLDGKPVPVIEHDDGRPAVQLTAGAHAIEGTFAWSALPETLDIPPATALIALDVNGRSITTPRRDQAGQLWLSAGATAEREGEHLELEVFRHVQDGVPLTITTRVALKASGRAREVVLDHVLVPGSVAYAIEADLPARLDNGKLALQLRAGTFEITITARTEGSPDRLTLQAPIAPWPLQEVWVFQADESVRQVRVGGVPGVDPAQTNLPQAWQQLPAYMLRADSALTFETTRRGQPEPPPNQLTLQRELWLDLDGTGYTVRDRLDGELHAGWRLSLPAGELGHVQGADGDQLITTLDKQSGVEVRTSHVALTAEWRNEQARSQLPAVGWSEDVQSLSAQLHLPPGWDVFTAQGVDHISNTWLQGWDLFRFFFVLIVALAAGRMFGAATGAVALVTLVLCHQQHDAPSAVWLVLLVVLGLLRVIPEGQWRTVMRAMLAVTLLSFALVAAPFAVTQIRRALYPQIDYSPYHYDEEGGFGTLARMALQEPQTVMVQAPAAPPVPTAAPVEAPEEAAADTWDSSERAAGGIGVVGSLGLRGTGKGGGGRAESDYSAQRKLLQDRDPNAVVQTGPGVPSRAFRTWSLTWTGPVERSATIELWLIPPLLNSALSVLRVLLIGLLAFLLVRSAPFKRSPGGGNVASAVAGAVVVLLSALTLAPHSAQADTPSPEILAELEARLYPAPTCAQCLSIAALDLEVKGSELRMTIEAHAAAPTTYRLPGPAQTWTPSQVTVDGRADAALALTDSGYLQLRLDTGTHRVELRGPLSAADAITLGLGDTPRRVTARAEGWDISGLHEDGTAEESVQLSRVIAPDPNATEQGQTNVLPPWLEVTRELDLGVAWHVTTRVRRVSPTGSAVLVRIPLLAGESVTAADLQVEDAHALVSLSRDATEASWTSTLKQTPELTLTAPSGKSWSEQWVVQCGRVFHCVLEGTAPIRHTAEGQWWPSFRPWPGETLTLKTERPLGAKGQSTTIDHVALHVSPGVRMRRSELSLSLRSSTGGLRTLSLPKDARIQNVSIDGQRAPIRFRDGQLSLGLTRGSHEVKVEWQEPGAMQIVDDTPAVAVGGPASNVTLSFFVPDERWLLFVSGPSWGPAILFWGYLLAMLLISLVLARIPHSPLRAYEWVLLTIGLTQIETIAQLVIAGWFFALAYRARSPLGASFFHNVWQLVLVGWTFVAFSCLYWALHSGLLFPPDMQVHNALSGEAELSWYVDRVNAALPTARVVSVSIWVWRCAMLAWALWLAWSLLRWLPWAWRSFTAGGGWKSSPPRVVPIAAPAPPTQPAAAPASVQPDATNAPIAPDDKQR